MDFKHKERKNQRKEFNSEITFLLLCSCFCFSFFVLLLYLSEA